MKCSMFLDDAGMLSSARTEYLEQQADLIRECGDIFRFKTDVRPEQISYCDVYLIDFGALSSPLAGGGPAEGQRYCDALVDAINEHPGTLFLIWSSFTSKWYREAIGASMFGSNKVPNNVILYEDGEKWDKVRAWLGVEQPEDDPECLIELYDEIEDNRAIDSGDFENPLHFFHPTESFIDWLVEYAGDRIMIDAGAGHMQLADAVADRMKPCIAVEPHPRGEMMDYLMRADGTPRSYVMPTEISACSIVREKPCLIIAARPDHSGWVREIPEFMHDDAELLYVGLHRNIGIDLDGMDWEVLNPDVELNGAEVILSLRKQCSTN